MRTLLLTIGLMTVGQLFASGPAVVRFDPRHEVSGQKFALSDLNPSLPRDWTGYEFVVLEFRISTPQRFNVGFTTDGGYNELRVMSYLPNGWNRLAIPLRFFRAAPDPRTDLAATFNQPRNTGWVNLGGRRGELTGVDSIGIRMRAPIGNPVLELRNVSLSVEDPGDVYLDSKPVLDRFGQHNLVDYPEKMHSAEELIAAWRAEEADLANVPAFNYSRYGGYLQKKVRATGFFRTEKIDGRWWMVDPEGYLFLSHGVDCIDPGRGGGVKFADQRQSWFTAPPPASFRAQNLRLRFGDDYEAAAVELTLRRMERWGINTVANWSSAAVYSQNRKAHTLSLRSLGIDGALMGLADVYAEGFAEGLDKNMASYLPQNADNPWVLGYFVANEPSWLGQEARLCQLILDGAERPIRAELEKFLAAGDTPERRREFVYRTFDTFLQTVRRTFKKHDPNHLILGIRFGNLDELDEPLMEICRRAFDILSFNCYALEPDQAMMTRALALTDRPMLIGEYHFGTVDRGLAQSLWQVDTEAERGTAYRYYTERGYSHPGLVGTGYFQWIDQDVLGRGGDGENYNCGLFDVTDRPYRPQVEAMAATALRLYEVHSGTLAPFAEKPARARGHEAIPDLWNE